MFVLNSDITIGNFHFSGVNEVHIQRSVHGISDVARIKIPSIARLNNHGKILPGNIVTGNQFKDGDPVKIQLGYNGNLNTEFIGFVTRRNLRMPLEVECEGYSWLLRRNKVNKFFKSITIKELLNHAVSDIDPKYKISVQCDVDIELSNIDGSNQSGFDIVNTILKCTDGNLSCFFIRPDTLWCGLLYTPYASGADTLNKGLVSYRLGYNVIKDNNLTERTPTNDPTQVTYSKKRADGSKISQTSDIFKNFARTHCKILNQLRISAELKRLAIEKSYQLNYSGYEGYLTTFLQPFVEPGYEASITDDRYPERTGKYLVESSEVVFGTGGARRIVEIGPKSGFANNLKNE